MRNFLLAVFVLLSVCASAQVNNSFRGTLNVFSATGLAPNYRVTGFFSDANGYYSSDSCQVGDVIFAFYTTTCVRFVVDSIITKAGSIITADVIDVDSITAAFPFGVSAIMRETPTNGFPVNISGISGPLASCIETHFKGLVDVLQTGTGGSPGNSQDTIVQVAHGLSLLDPVHVDTSGLWIVSNVSSDDSLHMAIVTEVIAADTFIVTYSGITSQPAHGYDVGRLYYVQDNGSYGLTAPLGLINDLAFYSVDANKLFITEQRPVAPMTDLNGIYSSSDTIPSGTTATAGNFQFKGEGNDNYYFSFNPENDIILMRGDSVLISLGVDGGIFTDVNASKRGLEYAASGYVTQPLSLTTKEYVDSTISDSLATITIPPTDLSFSGLGSPATLESSTGTDVTITAGAGIGLNVSGSDVTITNTGVTGTWGGVTTYLPRWNSAFVLGADSRYRFNDAYPALEIVGSYNSNSTQLLLSAGGSNPRIQTNTGNNGLIFATGGQGSYLFQNTTGTTRFEIVGGSSRSYFTTSLGVGLTTTPDAMLHTKGAGATSGTFSFLAENSAGTDALAVRNDGAVIVPTRTGTATALGGWDANNKSTDLALASGLSIVAGALTPADASATNELQTVTNTSDATTHTVTLSDGGGSIQLAEGANISLTTSGTAGDGIVTISTSGGAGEVNTASNLGAGAGVYEQKSSVDLQFNSLVSESTTALTIAEDDPNNTIDFTINTGAVANGAGTLTTGDQVYDFVTAQGNVYTKDDTISEDRIVTIAPDYLFKIRANDTYSSSGYFNFGTLNIDDRFGFDLYDANGTSSGRINSYYDIGSTGKNQLTIENVNSTELGRILMTHDGSEEQLTILNKNGADTTLISMTALGTTIQDDTELNVNTPNFQFTGAGFDVIASTNSVFTTPATQFTGTLRVDTDGSAATSLVGQDVSNRLTAVSLGYGLDLTSGVLLVDSLEYATQYDLSLVSGTTNLTFSGASSPVTLNSSSGTDVTFTAGTGVGLTGTATDLTITNTGDTNAADDVTTAGGTSGQVAYFNGTNTITSEAAFVWDATNDRLGIGVANPTARVEIEGAGTTSATYGLQVEDSSGANIVSVRDDRYVAFGATTGGSIVEMFTDASRKTYFDGFDILMYNRGSGQNQFGFFGGNGSLASPTDVAAGENLGEIAWYGYYNTADRYANVIRSKVDSVAGSTVWGRLEFNYGSSTPMVTMYGKNNLTQVHGRLGVTSRTGTATSIAGWSSGISTDVSVGYGLNLTSGALEVDTTLIGDGGGETNTASNLGAGAGVYEQKVSLDLQFNSLKSESTSQLTIAEDDPNNTIDFTINTGAVADAAATLTTGDQVYDFVTGQGYLTAEVDDNVSNEGSLSVGAGTANTSIINSNTSGSTGVTIEGGTNVTVTESGNTITIAATGGGATDLTFTGASSPYTLNSSTGTDVTFSEGEGISITRATNDLSIAADVMVGANGVSGGTAGIVPTPAAADNIDFLRGDGTWSPVEYTKNATIENPGSSENVTLFYTRRAITIREVADVVRGTSPSVTWQIKYATTRDSGSPTDLFSASRTTTSTSGATTTTFNDATIGAGNWIWLVTSATSGTNDELSVTLTYTID